MKLIISNVYASEVERPILKNKEKNNDKILNKLSLCQFSKFILCN
jgi:hypothetical protein